MDIELLVDMSSPDLLSNTLDVVPLHWLQKLSFELGIPTNSPITIFIDNQSAMCFAENPVFHAHSKHIDICHHFVHECLASNKVILNHCASKENVADIFTKPLVKLLSCWTAI